MKKILFSILAFFSITKITAMDQHTKESLKFAAFDSFEEETFDDGFEGDEDNYKGKPKAPKPQSAGGWEKTSGYFTINIVNLIAGTQKVELFSSLNNAVNVTNNTLFAGFSPFTAVNRAAANLNSVIYYNAAGDMIYQSAAGTTLTVSCDDIPYKTLLETLKFYSMSVKSIKMTFTADPQLSNKIQYIYQTFLGKQDTNQFSPRTYFQDNQYQTKQVTILSSFIINGERGINFTVNQGETIGLIFNLDAVKKG